MSAKSSGVPDAWDDNWETIADKEEAQTPNPQSEPKVPARVTKAQRRAQHAEFNRQLWAEAEAENTYHFLETRAATAPIKADYKTPVTVLSRKPQIARRPTSSSTSTLGSAVAGLSISDTQGNDVDDDDDSESDAKKPPSLTLEERQAIALKEREEKQRRYEEVRERLFGTSSATESGASSPGTTTPPVSQGQEGQNQRQERSNRWRGKNRQNNARGDGNKENRRGSPASNTSGGHKKLFDPGYSAKPNSNYGQRRDKQPRRTNTNTSSNNQSDDAEDFQRAQAPIRTPRGPDGSGRGGFGFGRGTGRVRG